MKKYILSIGIFIMSLLSLCGCIESLPSNVKFLEFPQFEQFNESISVIEVTWDVNESDIKNIIAMYKEATFVKVDTLNDGNHSSIKLIDGDGNNILIPLSNIKYGNKNQYYKYPDNSIYDYIKQVGQNLGALS